MLSLPLSSARSSSHWRQRQVACQECAGSGHVSNALVVNAASGWQRNVVQNTHDLPLFLDTYPWNCENRKLGGISSEVADNRDCWILPRGLVSGDALCSQALLRAGWAVGFRDCTPCEWHRQWGWGLFTLRESAFPQRQRARGGMQNEKDL